MQGDSARAGELAAESLRLAREWDTPKALAIALRAQALSTGELEPLEAARAALAGTPWRLEAARVGVDLGAALRRAGRRRAAREQLEPAMDLAHACGAAGLAERAAGELRALGTRPRRHAVTGRDALTPGERRVAVLAAGGAGNRAIAQELFITVATVETHLRARVPQAGHRRPFRAAGRAGDGIAPPPVGLELAAALCADRVRHRSQGAQMQSIRGRLAGLAVVAAAAGLAGPAAADASFTASVDTANKRVKFTGTDAPEQLKISGMATLSHNATGPGFTDAYDFDTSQPGTQYVTSSPVAPTSIYVVGRGGDDRIEMAAETAELLANGGEGDDVLTGSALRDHLEGALGDDHLWGRGSTDRMFGQRRRRQHLLERPGRRHRPDRRRPRRR